MTRDATTRLVVLPRSGRTMACPPVVASIVTEYYLTGYMAGEMADRLHTHSVTDCAKLVQSIRNNVHAQTSRCLFADCMKRFMYMVEIVCMGCGTSHLRFYCHKHAIKAKDRRIRFYCDSLL